jgi:tetratricopeptide (TPR) repeat protein
MLDGIELDRLSEEELLEHRYRTGRVLGGVKDYAGALSFYERTIAMGWDNPAFYACNAALQAGLIEEERGNRSSARRYFETCLQLEPDEYRTGLHILAKAGLNRLEN